MALVDLSVVEQRYRAVLAVERGELKMVVAAVRGLVPNVAYLVDPISGLGPGGVDEPLPPTQRVPARGAARVSAACGAPAGAAHAARAAAHRDVKSRANFMTQVSTRRAP